MTYSELYLVHLGYRNHKINKYVMSWRRQRSNFFMVQACKRSYKKHNMNMMIQHILPYMHGRHVDADWMISDRVMIVRHELLVVELLALLVATVDRQDLVTARHIIPTPPLHCVAPSVISFLASLPRSCRHRHRHVRAHTTRKHTFKSSRIGTPHS